MPAWPACSRDEANTAATPEGRPSALGTGASAAGSFEPISIGDPIGGPERPQIANVQLADLDRDGALDVLVCDAVRGSVSWIRRLPSGTYVEERLGEPIPAPANAQVADTDNDGDLDIVVASLGVLLPNNQRIGAVVILENDGKGRFTNRTVASGMARVAYVGPGDLDGDGDVDLAVAGFGYDNGETLWLEQTDRWQFTPHQLQRLSGAINAIVNDLDQDGDQDIVTLVSQEWEHIWFFENDGRGAFTARLLWGSGNADFGSSWISLADIDRDSDVDILYSNGDALDYAPNDSRPWHGVQWLENKGGLQFEMHRIADLSGASSPQAGDVDGDGDIDVVVVSAFNDWNSPAAISLAWLENNGQLQFTLRPLATSPTHLVTVAVGDLDRDGQQDLVTGGLHLTRPFDRMSRVTLWRQRGKTPAN
jgi:hypothetical protein